MVLGASGTDGESGAVFVFAVARYNEDGSLDTSFGSDGLVTTSFPTGTFAEAEAVGVDDDDKYVVVGAAGVGLDDDGVIIQPDFALARRRRGGSPGTWW